MKRALTNKQKEYIIFKDKLRLNFFSLKSISTKNALRFFCLHNLNLGDRICGYYFPFTLINDRIYYIAKWFSWITSLNLDTCYRHSSKFKQ